MTSYEYAPAVPPAAEGTFERGKESALGAHWMASRADVGILPHPGPWATRWKRAKGAESDVWEPVTFYSRGTAVRLLRDFAERVAVHAFRRLAVEASAYGVDWTINSPRISLTFPERGALFPANSPDGGQYVELDLDAALELAEALVCEVGAVLERDPADLLDALAAFGPDGDPTPEAATEVDQ